MRYIERNPVRAGLVQHPGDHPWSNDRRKALGESRLSAEWLGPHEGYLRLGGTSADRQGAYRQLFRAAVSGKDLREIRESTNKGSALGGDRFRGQVAGLSQRRAASKGVAIRKKGRES